MTMMTLVSKLFSFPPCYFLNRERIRILRHQRHFSTGYSTRVLPSLGGTAPVHFRMILRLRHEVTNRYGLVKKSTKGKRLKAKYFRLRIVYRQRSRTCLTCAIPSFAC